ncbi:MAG: hypothetical protein KKA73_18390 [Chloroflexi bacterium]|nr:hypothetical protein [Chloroflexota bacterium]MBU1749657.1 hypothetical protein [Chloroflexota bacterium]
MLNMSELALKMLEWEAKRRELDALTAEIQAAVKTIGRTQTVGNVRASYSKGRRTFDYQRAGQVASEVIIAACTTPRVDWRQVCQMADITDVPFALSAPSVTVKLLDAA